MGRAVNRPPGNGVWCVVKCVASAVLAVVLMVVSAPAPARAQDIFAGFVVARVCLPYVTRAKTFEGAIRSARDMKFRRPNVAVEPVDEWATEIEMVSEDGRWRLHIEEGTVTEGEADVYQVTCAISSAQSSARELSQVAQLMLRGNPMWSQPEDAPWRWDRRTARPEQSALRIDITEQAGEHPVLAARASYY